MFTSNWYWDTPEGGGWVRYWQGEFIDIYQVDDLARRYPHLVEQKSAVLDGWPGQRMPTPTERKAWKKIDPQIDDIGNDADDETAL